MRFPGWRAHWKCVLVTCLVTFPLGFTSAACCSSVCNRDTIPPHLVCTEREPPDDPLADSTFDDGFTDEQRSAYIRIAVGSTVEVSVARYTSDEGVRNYGGTGIVIGTDRTIITAQHVIENADYVTVTYRTLDADGLTVTRGRTIPVRVVATSEARDVALLRPVRADEPGFPPPLPVDTAWRPSADATVWNFGKTTRWSRGHILNSGTESADVENVVEVGMTVRPGDSGGPAMTPDGNVVGVILSRNEGNTDTTADDKGYFMPIHLALDALHYRP